MRDTHRVEQARAAYRAYETGDRGAIEALLDERFSFYSPADPGIDRSRYFERCWPNAQLLRELAIVRIVEQGDEVLVTYEATRTDASRFRNTEVLTFAGDKIVRAEVYFGWNL
jgi:ketosteroid isomerase-like protein